MNGKAGNEQVRVSLWALIFFFSLIHSKYIYVH